MLVAAAFLAGLATGCFREPDYSGAVFKPRPPDDAAYQTSVCLLAGAEGRAAGVRSAGAKADFLSFDRMLVDGLRRLEGVDVVLDCERRLEPAADGLFRIGSLEEGWHGLVVKAGGTIGGRVPFMARVKVDAYRCTYILLVLEKRGTRWGAVVRRGEHSFLPMDVYRSLGRIRAAAASAVDRFAAAVNAPVPMVPRGFESPEVLAVIRALRHTFRSMSAPAEGGGGSATRAGGGRIWCSRYVLRIEEEGNSLLSMTLMGPSASEVRGWLDVRVELRSMDLEEDTPDLAFGGVSRFLLARPPHPERKEGAPGREFDLDTLMAAPNPRRGG